MSTDKQLTLRSKLVCPLLGKPEDIKYNELPTKENVLKYYLYLKGESKIQKPTGLHPLVVDAVLQVWQTSSIPTVSKPRVMALLKKQLKSYQNLKKIINRKDSKEFKNKFASFKNNISSLFDISYCKCTDFSTCRCPKEKKVPIKERDFLSDQRSVRKMYIGSIDQQTTASMEASQQRRLRDISHPKPTSQSGDNTVLVSSSSTSPSEDSSDDFEKDLPPWHRGKKSKKHSQRKSLPNFAIACDRTGVSSRAAAMIVTAALHDIDEETDDIIDKNKVSRERQRAREQSLSSSECGNVTSIYFDGRKDKTVMMIKSESKRARTEVTEEHITVLSEPGSKYIGHFSVSSGSANNIVNGLYDFCIQKKIDVNKIDSIGCDGTNTNVGWRAGVIRKFEEKLGKPLQWIVCQLHSNELPLRHLLIHLDGKTSGPRQFTGPIGTALFETDFENLPVIDFEPISADAIDINQEYISDLSSDQKYLLLMYQAVSSGSCEQSLASQKPGKMAHSRWLTTASRALRLYVSTENPSNNLTLVVQFIMLVYTPMWFKIKCHSDITYAPLHTFETISRCQKLPLQVRDVVIPVIERNAYGAHHEAVLVAMISGTNDAYKELAWRRILRSREEKAPTGRIRTFRVPKLNINASSYIDLINWNDTCLSEPPLTVSISSNEIKEMITTKNFSFECPKLPCHTQSVERHIKLVTEASSSVCGQSNREGFIQNKLKSRAAMPQFNTKSQFKSVL